MSLNPRTSLLLCILVAATLLVYWPGLHGGFMLDDYIFIVKNTDLQIHALTWQQLRAAMLSEGHTILMRPLSYLSFAFNYYASGLDPFWMKLTNVAIHLCNGILLFGLLRTILPSAKNGSLRDTEKWEAFALLVTAGWMLAPINLSAVLYVYQRVESIANLFVFGGLWMYAAGRRRQIEGRSGGAWLIGTGVVGGAFVGALFKEDAALLPLYAFLLEALVFGFGLRRSRGLMAFYAVFLGLPAIAGTAAFLLGKLNPALWESRDFTLPQRLLTESRVVVEYARWTLLPTLKQLSFYHDDIVVSRGILSPPWTLGAIILILAAVVCIFLLRKRRPLVALGLAWFLAGQIMTGTVIPLELVFEHRNYFASAGLLLAFFGAFIPSERTAALPRARWLLPLLLLCLYAGTTALRAADWGDPLRLAYLQTRKNPDSPRARFELGYLLVSAAEATHDPKLLRPGMNSLEQAARMPGSSVLPEETLIYTASKQMLPVDPAWWDSLRSKLDHYAFSAEDLVAIDTLTRCTIEHICAANEPRMVPIYLGLIQRYPRDPQILVLYANYATWVLGDLHLARNLMAGAMALAPHDAMYQQSLRQIDAALKREPDAAMPNPHPSKKPD